ncbi:MAG: hypothetical protein AB1631_05670 [Acidobacteriota bacterium]
MQKVLKNIPDDRFAAYIVWLPMIRTDNRDAAVTRSTEFADKRLSYFWDGDRMTGKLWQKVLNFSATAWDIYFLYGAETRWEKEPSLPEFWMHQLGVAQGMAPMLNQEEFEAEARKMLAKIK